MENIFIHSSDTYGVLITCQVVFKTLGIHQEIPEKMIPEMTNILMIDLIDRLMDKT